MAKKLFKPGNPGRPKGSTNKSLTRARIVSILSNPDTWKKFEKELMALKGRAFVEAVTKLFEYDTPRYQAVGLSLSSMNEYDLQFLVDKLKEQFTHENTPD